MSIAQSEFWSRLVRSGIADPGSCQRYGAAFAQSPEKSTGDDGAAVAAFLVRTEVLTNFQAAQLLAADDSDRQIGLALRVGSYVMTSDQPVQPFSHWIPVQTPVTEDAPVPRYGFLLRVPLGSLDETRRSWIAVHSEIRAESLQAIELSGGAQAGTTDQTVEIFSPLPTGASLFQVLQTKSSLSPRKTVRIGVDLANALHALHQPLDSGSVLAHGAVGSDHVWVTPKGHAILLRDPSSPARSPLADLSTSWIEYLESPALHAAPELADSAVMPTPASDLYSLGSLLFRLLLGRPAFSAAIASSGEHGRALPAAHNQPQPPELIEAVQQGAAGNPLLRVLAYAMAQDPAARFDSAAAMAEALRRAGELVDAKPKPSSPKSKTKKTPPDTPPAARPPAPPADPPPAPPATAPPIETPMAALPRAAKRAPSPPAPPTVQTSPPPQQPAGQETPAAGNATTTSETAAPEIAPPDTAAAAPDAVPSAPPSTADADDPEGRPTRRKRRTRRKNRIPILAGMMVLPLMMLALAIALRGRGPVEPPPPRRPSPGIINRVPEVRESRREVADNQPTLVNGYEIVDSDRLLWVPPYSADSPPPSLELLPPGPAMILSIPLAQVSQNADARSLTSTFDAELSPWIELAQQRAGVPKDQIARCTAAFFPGKDGWPEVALVVDLVTPVALDTLTEKWQAFESRTPDGVIIYAGEDLDGDAYYVGGGEKGKPPEGGNVGRFAIASLDRIREVAETEGASIPLVRSMQTLWNQTSAESDLVALVTPNFLFADGRQMLDASLPEFTRPLKRWLIPDVAAFSLSASAGDGALYLELRELPSGGATAATLLKAFRDTTQTWPDWADQFILTSVPDPSWRLLATRLPLMLRFVNEQTRSSILGETVVASTYLPVDAGSQIALGTFLAMNTPAGADTVAGTTKAESLSLDQILDRPMSISFLQLSLQFAVDAVVDEFKQTLPEGSTMPGVRIIGADLEKNGITQNQQIRNFEHEDQPLRKVLTELVLGANPDKTATGPTDPKQSLIWVVHPTGKPPEETEILITTRDAAAGKYELPEEFRIPEGN
ncbi:Serine/threonine-protein kinase PknK [Stieleria maiorica]|uniref:Serine/threonine-protein kinase PknK n=1 Tax=Stieleria maiorica TaxID=2795974 RepID=A0A5B9MMS0_9BACT|nr:hypothetical protein [Stieleria maiorica]QEG01217.1 Serine/threonine-protein kinase PknK [Stieleria maiorica]